MTNTRWFEITGGAEGCQHKWHISDFVHPVGSLGGEHIDRHCLICKATQCGFKPYTPNKDSYWVCKGICEDTDENNSPK
jgi:hypothetical protein